MDWVVKGHIKTASKKAEIYFILHKNKQLFLKQFSFVFNL